MKRSNNSIDGFVARQRSSDMVGSPSNPQKIGVARDTHNLNKKSEQPVAAPVKKRQSVVAPASRTASLRGIDTQALDSSLAAIDSQEKAAHKKHSPERKARRRKIVKWTVIVLVLAILIPATYIGVKAMIAGGKSFKGGLLGLIQKAQLKQDGNGRSNILIFGTSEDSDGGNHPGGDLTDSIMLLSVNQEKKDAFMVSIPRDLWVKLDNPCDVGYEEKINVVYRCASDGGKNEQKGADSLRKKVGQILGVDVQYYAHLNYKVVADAVNAVGGVEVKIETDDPRGIYDPNFDWTCNHQCKLVYYKKDEIAKLDGQRALALARARNAQGGYGLSGGNFDRERNQQKILRALQEKALTAGTLTNLGKVTGLIDALGNNLRTNIETSEVRALLDLAQEIKGDKLQSIALDTEGEAVVATGNHLGRSIVRPVKGLYDYTGIQRHVAQKMGGSSAAATPTAPAKPAVISVFNGSGVEGLAKREGDSLVQKGMKLSGVGNAPGGVRAATTVYQIGEVSEAARKQLEERYKTKVIAGTPPVAVGEEVDFVIILGTSAR